MEIFPKSYIKYFFLKILPDFAFFIKNKEKNCSFLSLKNNKYIFSYSSLLLLTVYDIWQFKVPFAAMAWYLPVSDWLCCLAAAQYLLTSRGKFPIDGLNLCIPFCFRIQCIRYTKPFLLLSDNVLP